MSVGGFVDVCIVPMEAEGSWGYDCELSTIGAGNCTWVSVDTRLIKQVEKNCFL